MKDISYVNSRGEKLDLLKPPYLLQTGELFDYEWGYNSVVSYSGQGKITSFSKEIKERPLTLSILNYSRESYERAIDLFFETVDFDVLNRSPGKLYVGDQYQKCYIITSEKTGWEYDIELLDNTVTYVTEKSVWITEHPYYFRASEILSSNNKRYPGRYAYRYANGLTNTSITNEHYAECNFRLIIYGPCTNPAIYVGGYGYLFKIVLEEGEYLEIDSAAETVTKYMTSGIKVNAFNNRNFADSVFRPIQTGRQEVNWNGRFDFDLLPLEERSEPKWS